MVRLLDAYTCPMKARGFSRYFAIMLVVWLSAVPGLSAIPFTMMSVEQSISLPSGAETCAECPTNMAGKDACELICLNAVLLATIPLNPVPVRVASTVIEYPGISSLAGRNLDPEPSPPRSANLL